LPGLRKKKRLEPPPSLDRLSPMAASQGSILDAETSLVSHRCGVVRELRQVPRDPSEPIAPYVFRAQLANHRFARTTGDELIASGKGMSVEEARASALGEAVERYSAASWGEADVIFAPRGALVEESIDPRDLVLYRLEQYGNLPYAPYDAGTPLGWTRARSLVTGRPVLVPALAVNMAYQVRTNEEYLFGPTSNGLAAGSTLIDAVLSATLEVMERDAFMIAWLNSLPGIRLDPTSHPDPDVRHLAHAYRRRGVELHLTRLPVDHPVHVILCVALEEQDRLPSAVIGLGADLNPARAARKAVLEVGQVRPAIRMRLRDPETRARLDELVDDPHQVSALEDHDLLYASPAMTRALDFLVASPTTGEATDWDADVNGEPIPDRPLNQLRHIIDHFRSVEQDLLYGDLSPPDMIGLGLHTSRVIIPGFQPIDFGWAERRLGGSRLFELPHRLGLAPTPTNLAMLNDLPHPLA
jgi:ribosomal protein S12 methylthiotransferase accessory factor